MTKQVKDNDVELHDDEYEIVDEAHDLMNAEVQSVQSVDATNKNMKRAPARKGDKRNSEAPKTVSAKIGAMYDKMKGLSKEDLDVAYDAIMGDSLYENGEVVKEELDIEVDFTEDLNALMESEATLSDEFKGRAAVIFEAAIKSKLSTEIDRLEAEYDTNLNEAIEEISSDIVDKVDSYLNYVVETWMEENEIAIEQGLRTEIAENFMENLKSVFEESYIEIPESKVDLVDELSEQVSELELQLDKTMQDAIQMSEELEVYKRAEVVREHADGLAETQVEKLLDLVSDLSFEDEESFSDKVKTVRESYFTKSSGDKPQSLIESDDASDEEINTENSPRMDAYVSALKKMSKNP